METQQRELRQEARPGSRSAVIHFTIYGPGGFSISSYESGFPFRFVPGSTNVLPGLEAAVSAMEIGETRRIHLEPREGFGTFDPRRVLEVDHERVYASVPLFEGQPVRVFRNGRLRQAFVRELRDQTTVLDLNHPLAGVEITMDVTLLAYE